LIWGSGEPDGALFATALNVPPDAPAELVVVEPELFLLLPPHAVRRRAARPTTARRLNRERERISTSRRVLWISMGRDWEWRC
jgi:hypothetical protein